jgi:lipoprotein-anchoring transpeptidase ErfK/SrfK
MRWGLVAVLTVLIAVPAGAAARTQVTIQATPAAGAAPLRVTFTTGGASSAHWEFGDGSTGDGVTVEHVYAAGRWNATATAQASDGTSSTHSVAITAYGLTLSGPKVPRYGRRTAFRGTLVPAERGVAVSLNGPTGKLGFAKTNAQGAYLIRGVVRTPGEYVAASDRATSAPLALRVVPKLVTSLVGGGARGSRYFFTARLTPAAAGSLAVKITRASSAIVERAYEGRVRIKLDTRRLTTYVIRTSVVPNEGFGATARVLRARVVLPRLALGNRNPAVAQLGDQLRRLHYAAPYGATYDGRMLDAVYAFQKVQGLPRTGAVDARFWRALAAARVPIPRYAGPADHLEVNKGRQVLYVVRGSQVALIVPISTAGLAGTFTPVGRFAIYRKVVGFDPSPLGTLFDPMYFTGGYAIHGNPSVPPYPASHGCVRVPMWIAPLLYATNPHGETVYVY